jgi:NhaP-type Na+/H+ or K+/H+ antiporter
VNPERLLRAAFQPLVSLAVAVILYDAGLGLELGKLRGHTRRVVIRLITWGVAITWAFGAAFAALLVGMSAGAALMTGAILAVSGPTVIAPLLRFIRPAERLRRVLAWEGSLIDPVGGILRAVVYAAVAAGARKYVGYQLGEFLITVGIGLAGGSSASRCCGSCWPGPGSARCSAPRPSWPAWPPGGTSPARTRGCWAASCSTAPTTRPRTTT